MRELSIPQFADTAERLQGKSITFTYNGLITIYKGFETLDFYETSTEFILSETDEEYSEVEILKDSIDSIFSDEDDMPELGVGIVIRLIDDSEILLGCF